MNWIEYLLPSERAWVELALRCAAAILIGLVLHSLLYRAVQRLSRGLAFVHTLVTYGRRPTQLLLPLLLLQIALGDAPSGLPQLFGVQHLLSIVLIATVTYFCMQLVKALADTVIRLHPAEVSDNLRARSVHTQTLVLERTVMILIGLVGIGLILMTFPEIRQLGTSLLASAGVAGLVAGIAARPVLGNLIAGLQIALTQPIRIDDVLIIEGEWGRVEEITGSYVVVRIWDDRRMIVPLEWFIQHPFQNWTRTSSHLLGTVHLWVDYAMPLAPLRAELERICRAAPEWDGRLCLLQVTDSSERALQLRALVSARDATLAFDLRCRVRESLVEFIQRHYPACLPRVRGAFETLGEIPRAGGEKP